MKSNKKYNEEYKSDQEYKLCNNVKDLPVIFDGSNVVSVNRDNHYHNYVHLKKEI